MSNPASSAAAVHTPTGRIPELDGLRGTAIAMVLVYHYFLIIILTRPGSILAYFLAAGRLAWTGVDLFFVLSGFLIGGILLDARESVNYFKVFYTRRFFRIVPIYLVVLACAFCFSIFFRLNPGPRFEWLSKDQLPWFPHIVFLQNFWMATKNTFGASTTSVTWSLAVEEQFYLTLPILIRLLPRRQLIWALSFGVFLAPCFRLALYSLWPRHPYACYVLMPCRADALLLGVLAAVAMRDARTRSWLEANKRTFLLVLLILVIGMAALTKMSGDLTKFPMLSIGYTWIALTYACILLFALTQTKSLPSRWLCFSWIGSLGTIAYGVYLFHQPIQGLLYAILRFGPPQIKSFPDFGLSLLALFFTLVLSHFSWKYFERPLVRFGHRANYRFIEQPSYNSSGRVNSYAESD